MVKLYIDICADLECLEATLQRLKLSRQNILDSITAPREMGGINYDGMPKGSADHTPLEVKITEMLMLDNKIEAISKMIGGYSEVKNQIDQRLSKLEGLAYKVVYMRDIKHMQIEEIADELGYSANYIYNISSKNSKNINVKGDKTV